MSPVLLIFTQISIAGGAFLVYFLVALRRELRNSPRGPKVEIRPVSPEAGRQNVIELYTINKISAKRAGGAHR